MLWFYCVLSLWAVVIINAIAPGSFVIRECLMFALGISLSHGDGGFDRSEVEAFNLLSRKS